MMKCGQCVLWCVVVACVIVGVVQAEEAATSSKVVTEPSAEPEPEPEPSHSESEDIKASEGTPEAEALPAAPSEDQVAEEVLDKDGEEVVESKDEDEEYVDDGEMVEEKEEVEDKRVHSEAAATESEGSSAEDNDDGASSRLAVCVPAVLGGVLVAFRLHH